MSALIAELSERWSIPKPWIWIEVRELFSESEEGESARAPFEQARARKSQGDPADGLDPLSAPRRYGMQVTIVATWLRTPIRDATSIS